MARYKITEDKVRIMANQMNARYFDSKLNLDVVDFKLHSSVKSLGQFIVERRWDQTTISIKINKNFTSRREAITTVTHELIHYWQYTEGFKGSHGRSFQQKAHEINQDPRLKIKIQAQSSLDLNVVAVLQKEKTRKNKNKNTFAITWNDKSRVLFIKNLDAKKINKLKILINEDVNLKIYKFDKLIPSVRHCQNVEKLLSASYYYDSRVFNKITKDNKIKEV